MLASVVHNCYPPQAGFESGDCLKFAKRGADGREIIRRCSDKMAETLFAIDADYPAAQAKVKKAMAYVHECFGGSMKQVGNVLVA